MVGTDRYIINRNSYDDFTSYFLLSQSQKKQETCSSDQKTPLSYREKKKRKHMSYLLHGYEIENLKVLDHTKKPREARLKDLKVKDRIPRKVKAKPERILEAPNVINDYYTFSIDWGHHNTLAVALDNCVYTWNTERNKTLLIAEYPIIDNRYVNCVSWKPKNELLAVTSTRHDTIDILAEPYVIQTLRTNLSHQVNGTLRDTNPAN
uniref:Cell division cycle protein 20 homolog n=1 Tax=Cacopsylla melanoneura TaxID=428564 RepID=A0A8D8U452_9HEMI